MPLHYPFADGKTYTCAAVFFAVMQALEQLKNFGFVFIGNTNTIIRHGNQIAPPFLLSFDCDVGCVAFVVFNRIADQVHKQLMHLCAVGINYRQLSQSNFSLSVFQH